MEIKDLYSLAELHSTRDLLSDLEEELNKNYSEEIEAISRIIIEKEKGN